MIPEDGIRWKGLLPLLAGVALLGGIRLITPDADTSLEFMRKVAENHTRSGWAVFRSLSFLAEGPSLAVLVIGLFLWRKYAGLCLLLNYAFSGLVAQLLKKGLFQGVARPVELLGEGIIPEWADPSDFHHWRSFPSGHTTTAFAMAACLLLMMPLKPWQRWSLVLLATGTGLSRIYLFQHFPADVAAGSLLGLLCGSLISWVLIDRLRIRSRAWWKEGILGPNANPG